MHKTITAISSFGSCSVLIVWAKANMDPLFSKFEILHSHAEEFPDTESALFEHETQQAITETRRVTVGVLPHTNAVDVTTSTPRDLFVSSTRFSLLKNMILTPPNSSETARRYRFSQRNFISKEQKGRYASVESNWRGYYSSRPPDYEI